MNPLFKYAFIDENGEYYYVDSNGDVDTSVSIQYLEDDPKDWQNTQVSFTRDGDYHGMMRKSTTPLIFHSNAAKILRSIYYTNFANGYCKVEIYKQNRDFTTNNLNYALWYTCEVDFTQSTDGDMELPNGDVYFNVRLLELGLSAVLEAHADDTYEIPIYLIWGIVKLLDSDAKLLEIGNITMDSYYEWVIPALLDSSGNPVFNSGDYFPTIASLKTDQVFEVLDTTTQIDSGIGTFQTRVFEVLQNHNSTIDLSFEGEYTNSGPNGTISYELRRIIDDKDANTISNTVIWSDSQSVNTGQIIPFSITDNFNLDWESGWSLRYVFAPNGTVPPQSPAIRVSEEGFLKVYATYITPSSQMYGFTYKDLLQKVLDKMGTGYTIESDLLDDDFLNYFVRPAYCLVVPAASIRNLDDPRIKTSFNEIIKDLMTMFGAGWGIEGNTLRIEKAEYFYNQSIDLLEIEANSTVQKTISNEYIYNRIKIGFTDTSVDEVNGLQEFCCEHEYNCGLNAPTIGAQELNLISPFIHGLYSIENIRSYIFRTDSTSIPTDNETCVIEYNQIVGSVHYPAKTGFNGTDFTTGVKYPADIYNTGHSPKACLIRNLNYIKSYLKDGQIITFNTATKNALLEYGNTVDGIRIQENSNIEITADGAMIPSTTDLYPDIDRIFLPYIFTYKGEVPENLLALMETVDSGSFKKYGVVTIFDNGAELKMFVLDIGVNPASEDVYQIRGLCTPSVNLNNLIR